MSKEYKAHIIWWFTFWVLLFGGPLGWLLMYWLWVNRLHPDQYNREIPATKKPKTDSNKLMKEKNDIVFYHKSPVAVALLSILTCNIYSLYWSFKHWKSIQDSLGNKSTSTSWWTWGGSITDSRRTYPVFAAIFQLFSIYPLFKLIK